MTTLDELNRCDTAGFVTKLTGIYEHSPWIAECAAARRPFRTPTALKLALQAVVIEASEEKQLDLIGAHPELAGKAAIAGSLTRESTEEQARAGLNNCSAEEFARLQERNTAYKARFGFPFVLAVKGPDGNGLSRQTIIDSFGRRLKNRRADEIAENLRQIGRIAELRLNALLGLTPNIGGKVLAWSETLAQWSDEESGLTCAYMTEAHRCTADQIARWMREAGMETEIDAVGNVVGRYRSGRSGAKTLITGSHYDTVRKGGKYDGREGILVPIAVVAELHARGEKLPYDLEVIAFAEEEGVRFRSTFLGSSAIVGQFDMSWLDGLDADGMTMREALQSAGHDPNAIAALARKPEELLGFVEVHIEQGPVLLEHGLPAGIVTSIAGSLRYLLDLSGTASHAGTTPMHMRRDAAAGAAEIVLFVERRCSGIDGLVGTVGKLEVPAGSINVVPGACRLSLDIRAPDDSTRDAAVADILKEIEAICTKRRIDYTSTPILKTAAVPCAPSLMRQLADAVEREGIAPMLLPSGAGHDAMMLARITDVAMLFTRCGNGGISHNPLETMTADDADISARILLDFLRHFDATGQGA